MHDQPDNDLTIETVDEPVTISERGASLVEYALLVALIAVVCIAAVSALGTTTAVPYSEITSGIAN